ncbi:hypothetical protein FAK_06370 [Desulfoferula mesophila]|uniref:Porin n=2 Tax=Desulfoferula mesophila TaxID=3058419 RepID=A0AAU9EHW2_9BACT|nr:hypothetical protein FAK_06370 [Desulfoferula mesophilus]
MILAAVALWPGTPPSALAQPAGGEAAQDYAAKVRQMQQVIELQQRQLQAQQKQLEQQQQMLRALQEQVSGLVKAERQPAATPAPAQAAAPKTAAVPKAAKQAEEDWPGSFAVAGSKTRMALGGFAELDLIHDTGAITSPADFVTADIVTRGATKAEGSDGQTTFSVKATRFWFETRTPLEEGRLKTFLSVDFFGDPQSASPDLRLREAYGELSRYVFGGDLLVGQTWSTIHYADAWPNILDYEGPSAEVGQRLPQVRWSRAVGQGLTLKLGLESPDDHIIQGADALTTWPDGVASLEWLAGPLKFQGSALLRDLRASQDNGPSESALGWGLLANGNLGLPWLHKGDNLTFSLAYGQGMGSTINDAPPDAYYNDTDNSLEVLPVWGYYLAYEHRWTENLTSVILYGGLYVDNADNQPYDSYHSSQYSCANLIWQPASWWVLGGELLWGERVDKDGASGDDTRLQLTSKFIF